MRKEDSFSPISENQLKDVLNFDPVEKLGQSFLVDPKYIKRFVSLTIKGADVVEIGSGPGNLTAGISKIAHKVTGLEIYPDYAEAQAEILDGCSNVEIININALKFDFRRWIDTDLEFQHQVIGNIPFHISEPLLTTLAQVSERLDNITLMVGDNLAETLGVTNPYSDRYTRLSFIASIFDVSKVDRVPRTSCWPVPRTDSDIISLTPKEYPEDGKTFGFQLKRKIVLNLPENLALIKVINSFSVNSDGGKVLGKDISHRYDRRQTRTELKRMTIDLNRMPSSRRDLNESLGKTGRLSDRIRLPSEVLSKPFSRLNNQEVRQLAMAIDQL